MGDLWIVAIVLLLAVFIIKVVVKMTLRLVLLAVLVVAVYLFYTGSLTLPL